MKPETEDLSDDPPAVEPTGMVADSEVPLGETTEPDEEPLSGAPVRAVLEALLFASDEPVAIEEVVTLLGEERRKEIEDALSELVREFDSQDRGLRVQSLAGGFRITTAAHLGPYLREMVRARNRQRLSRAALETLAVVAYKQPITAPEIQEIRGVNPAAILNALLDRRLVRVLGRKKVVGKPFLYGTSREFLVRFGLNSLEDLPSMEEFAALIEPEEPELPLAEATLAAPDSPHAEIRTGSGEIGE